MTTTTTATTKVTKCLLLFYAFVLLCSVYLCFYSLLLLYFYFSPHGLFHQNCANQRWWPPPVRRLAWFLWTRSPHELCVWVSLIENIDKCCYEYTKEKRSVVRKKQYKLNRFSYTLKSKSCVRENVLFKWNDEWIIKWKHYTQSIESTRAAKKVCIEANLFGNIAWTIKKSFDMFDCGGQKKEK